MRLKAELTDWVKAYKDAAERNALAEDPDESAEYLLSLIWEVVEGAGLSDGEVADLIGESEVFTMYPALGIKVAQVVAQAMKQAILKAIKED